MPSLFVTTLILCLSTFFSSLFGALDHVPTQPPLEKEAAPAELTIWGVTESPYVRKLCVVCLEKGIPYHLKETLPAKILQLQGKEIPPGFQEASVLGKIPAINDHGFVLSDSAVISVYLEKKYTDHPIYPTDVASYAKVLWFEKYVDDEMAKVLHEKIFMERVIKPGMLHKPCNENLVQHALKEELPPFLDYLEKVLKEGSWPRTEGGITVADIALASHMIDLQLSHVALDRQRWPTLLQHVDTLLQRPSFVQAQAKK